MCRRPLPGSDRLQPRIGRRSPTFSDGTSLLFTRGKAERGKKLAGAQVWRSDRDGGNARQVTQSGDRNSGARWSPDGRTIAFVSDRVKKSGLFLLGEGGEAQELTRHNGSISELAWSPDGRSIAYTALFDPENPEEADLGPEDAPPVRVTAESTTSRIAAVTSTMSARTPGSSTSRADSGGD